MFCTSPFTVTVFRFLSPRSLFSSLTSVVVGIAVTRCFVFNSPTQCLARQNESHTIVPLVVFLRAFRAPDAQRRRLKQRRHGRVVFFVEPDGSRSFPSAAQSLRTDVDFDFCTVNPCRERKNRAIPTGGGAKRDLVRFHTSRTYMVFHCYITLYGYTCFDPVPTALVRISE